MRLCLNHGDPDVDSNSFIPDFKTTNRAMEGPN